MSDTKYPDKKSVHEKALQAKGIPFGEIYPNVDNGSIKGGLGQMIEEYWFGLKLNNESRPDFEEAGVELKVTGYKTNKNKSISAKERLVLNIIDYEKEDKLDFETSSFWYKNKLLEIMVYEYLKDVKKSLWSIHYAFQFTYPEEDLVIIRQDYNKISNKIHLGLAHELSEGDTIYLGACTKGANSNSLRKQPNSSIDAKQRAFCLKQSYLTEILRNYINPKEIKQNEYLITENNLAELKTYGFESLLINKTKEYVDKTEKEICKMLKVFSINQKNKLELLFRKMLNVKSNFSKVEEFNKANITTRVIRLNQKNKMSEDISFPVFDPDEIVKQEWEDSEFYDTLSQTKFLFAIFKLNENNEYVFKGLKFWNMPIKDIEQAGIVWTRTRDMFAENTITITRGKQGKFLNNLPSKTESNVAHVRPHASQRAYKLNDGTFIGNIERDAFKFNETEYMTKQCFWLNRDYVEEIFKNE